MKKAKLSAIIGICVIAYIMSYFHRVTPTILSMDLLADFNIAAVQLGIFSSATMLAYGLMQLPSGILSDLFGGRNTLICLSLITGIGTVWFSLTHTMDGVFFSRFLTGIGLAVTVPIVTVLAEWCPPKFFVRISALIFSTAGIGGILAAPPLYKLGELFGWRTTMAGFGLFSLALSLLILIAIPRKKCSAAGRQSPLLAGMGKSILKVLGSRVFWTLGIWYMMLCGASYCMSTLWWGPYLMQGLGLDKATVSTVISGISVGILASFLTLGAIADSIIKNRKVILLTCSFLACLSLGLLVFQGSNLSVPVITVAAAIFAGASSAIGPVTYAVMKDSYPQEMTGTAVGLVNMTFPLWSSVLQYLYGTIILVSGQYFPQCNPHTVALGVILINCLIACLFLCRLRYQSPCR